MPKQIFHLMYPPPQCLDAHRKEAAKSGYCCVPNVFCARQCKYEWLGKCRYTEYQEHGLQMVNVYDPGERLWH